MNGLAQAVAIISAVVYIAAAPQFLFGNPRVRAFLHVEADNVPGGSMLGTLGSSLPPLVALVAASF